jgi:hypothetical protein
VDIAGVIASAAVVLGILLVVGSAVHLEHFKGRSFWDGVDHMLHDPNQEMEEEETQYPTREFNSRASLTGQNEEEEGEEEESMPLGERVNAWIREVLPWW